MGREREDRKGEQRGREGERRGRRGKGRRGRNGPPLFGSSLRPCTLTSSSIIMARQIVCHGVKRSVFRALAAVAASGFIFWGARSLSPFLPFLLPPSLPSPPVPFPSPPPPFPAPHRPVARIVKTRRQMGRAPLPSHTLPFPALTSHSLPPFPFQSLLPFPAIPCPPVPFLPLPLEVGPLKSS